MISRHWLRGSVALLAFVGATLSPIAAHADTPCSSDSDCSKGFTCQMTGVSGCPPVAACPLGGSGADCAVTPCEPQVVSDCEPGPCSTDSDCADGMVCHADVIEGCATPACAPGETYAGLDAGGCTTTTVSTCVPPYDLPCQVNSDCGAGFNCVPDTITACSGTAVVGSATTGGAVTASGSASGGAGASGGLPTPDAADAGAPTSLPPILVDAGALPPPTCTTTTLSTSSCIAQTILCSTDADCPTSWTCVSPPSAVSTACVEVEPAENTSVAVSCEAGVSTPAPMQCVPPYYTVTSGAGVANSTGSGLTTGGAVAPSAAPSSPAGGANGTGSDMAGGGCQIGSRSTDTGAPGLFALVGLFGAALRRRRASR